MLGSSDKGQSKTLRDFIKPHLNLTEDELREYLHTQADVGQYIIRPALRVRLSSESILRKDFGRMSARDEQIAADLRFLSDEIIAIMVFLFDVVFGLHRRTERPAGRAKRTEEELAPFVIDALDQVHIRANKIITLGGSFKNERNYSEKLRANVTKREFEIACLSFTSDGFVIKSALFSNGLARRVKYGGYLEALTNVLTQRLSINKEIIAGRSDQYNDTYHSESGAVALGKPHSSVAAQAPEKLEDKDKELPPNPGEMGASDEDGSLDSKTDDARPLGAFDGISKNFDGVVYQGPPSGPELAKFLAEIKKDTGLSNVAFAKAAGISEGSIRLLEKGSGTSPSAKILEGYAKASKKKLAFIFTPDDGP